MAQFTANDHRMFGKWYGRPDLLHDDAFWQDVLTVYKETALPLPVTATPQTLADIHALLDCPPGKCSECCRYRVTRLTMEDRTRLLEARIIDSAALDSMCVQDGDGISLKTEGGCPFLANNACTVYEQRPEICRAFPIIAASVGKNQQGQEIQQVFVRVKCQAAITVTRRALERSFAANPGLLLLPDLTVVIRRS
jgi:Fe-S-cluster containining protein